MNEKTDEKNSESSVVEITSFRIKNNVEKEKFIEVAKKMEEEFLKNQNGYISRTLSVDENEQWIDIVFWRSKKDHLNALSESEKSQYALPFINAIDFETVEMKLNQIK